jgi:hypothetical protein
MNGWHAFVTGLRRMLHYPQVWLLVFAVNLFSALLLAVLPALGLASGLGQRPAIFAAADGLDAWLVIETLMSSLSTAALGESGAFPRATLLFAPLLVFVLPLVAWLPGAFLHGGLLLTYAEAPQPFRWRRFLWGGWHWWGAFLLLGAVQGAVSAVLLLLTATIAGIVAALGTWAVWIAAPLLVLLSMLGLALLEFTRAFAIVDGTCNLAQAFGRATSLVLRRPLAVGLLYGLSFLLVGLLHAVFRLGLFPYLPLEMWPLVLVAQQAFIVLRLGTRLARLAGGITLLLAAAEPA